MIKKGINFLNEHRLLLIILILLLFIIIFFAVNIYLFFHHEFTAFKCSENINEEICYYNDLEILVNPESTKKAFFKRYDDEIEELKENYNLEEFNYYTAYYYLTAARLQYETKTEYKLLLEFFERYVNTYNLEDFYFDYVLYFNMFYRYKIN